MDRSGVPEAARLSTIDDHVRIFIGEADAPARGAKGRTSEFWPLDLLYLSPPA